PCARVYIFRKLHHIKRYLSERLQLWKKVIESASVRSVHISIEPEKREVVIAGRFVDCVGAARCTQAIILESHLLVVADGFALFCARRNGRRGWLSGASAAGSCAGGIVGPSGRVAPSSIAGSHDGESALGMCG